MSKKLTTYKRPPILTMIQSCTTIDELAMHRDGLILAMRRDDFTPQRATVETWLEAIWTKALQFIKEAPTAEQLNYTYNVLYKWPKPGNVERVLALVHGIVAKKLPSPAERDRAAGITYAS